MKIVILGRDGVINQHRINGVRTALEWEAIPGSLDAIARLNRAGYRVIVTTNQPGVAKGNPDLETLHSIHQKMNQAICTAGGVLDGLYFCPHDAAEQCHCRKPNTGLLEEIASRLHCDLQGIPFIGDGLNDLQAAAAAGATPILVRTGLGKKTEGQLLAHSPIAVFDNLAAAVDQLLLEMETTDSEV